MSDKMTVKEFFEAGHKFVVGDVYTSVLGKTLTIEDKVDVVIANDSDERDDQRYVIKAAALEEKPQWDGEGLPPVGVECECFDYDSDTYIKVKVLDAYTNSDEVAVASIRSDGLFARVFWGVKFRPLETPEQREKREKLEAAYDLCCTYGHNDFVNAKEFEQYHPSLCDKWLAIVEKTGYRVND